MGLYVTGKPTLNLSPKAILDTDKVAAVDASDNSIYATTIAKEDLLLKAPGQIANEFISRSATGGIENSGFEVKQLYVPAETTKIATHATISDAIASLNLSNFQPTKEWWVDTYNGTDSASTAGKADTPFKTIAYALTRVGNTGEALRLYPGTYSEAAVTVTDLNVDFLGTTRSGIVNIVNPVTFNHPSSSIRCEGVSFAGGIVYPGAGLLFLINCAVLSFSKTGAGYCEIINGDTGAVSLTGAGFVISSGGKIAGNITVNNASAIFSSNSNIQISNVIVTNGTASIHNASGIGAVSAANASTVYIKDAVNCGKVTVTGTAYADLDNTTFVASSGYAIDSSATATVRMRTITTTTSSSTVNPAPINILGAYDLIGSCTFRPINAATNPSIISGTRQNTIDVLGDAQVLGEMIWYWPGTTQPAMRMLMGELQMYDITGALTHSLNPALSDIRFDVADANIRTESSGGLINVGNVTTGDYSESTPEYIKAGNFSTPETTVVNKTSVVIGDGAGTITTINNNGLLSDDGTRSAAINTESIAPPEYSELDIATLEAALAARGETKRLLVNETTTGLKQYNPGTQLFESIAGGGGGSSMTLGAIQTSNFTAVANTIYPVNTTGGAITATLPATPNGGQVIEFVDYANKFSTNNLIVGGNGQKINTSLASLTISAVNANPKFTYIDSTQGWAHGDWDGSLAELPSAAVSDLVSQVVYDTTSKKFKSAAVVVEFGAVLDNTLTTPPASPAVGDRYLCPNTGSVLPFTNNRIAEWTGSAWVTTTPVQNAFVTITGGTNAGAVLTWNVIAWIPAPNAGLVVPRNSVLAPPTAVGSLYQDSTNELVDSIVATANPVPLSPVNVRELLTATPTGAKASGLYIQTAGTLPALTAGSAAIALNDVYYWNSISLTAYRKYSYARCPAIIGVGTTSSVLVYQKNGAGSWGLGGGSSTLVTQTKKLVNVSAGGNYNTGNQFIPAWQFTHTGTGAKTRIQVDCTGYAGNAAPYLGFTLFRNGVAVASISSGNGNTIHAFMGSMNYISDSDTGTNTYQVKTNVVTVCDATDFCNVIITEFFDSSTSSGTGSYGVYDIFSTSALPTSGYLRQGTGPYSAATYPALAAVMPAVPNTIGNTGQGQAPVVAAKTGSNTMVVFTANTYGYTTNGGANWTSVTHNQVVSYQGDANQNFAFFPCYGGNTVGVLVDLNNPATHVTRSLNDTLGYVCTAAGASAFLVNSVAANQGNIVQRSIDNFVTRANITLPANFLSTDASGALIRGHYLTNTVIAVRAYINSSIIARSTNAGDSAVANGAATFAQVNLPSAQSIASISTDGAGKWLLAPSPSSSGFYSTNDGVTWTQFTSPATGTAFNISGWDGVRWVMMTSGGTSFWYSTTGATGTWINKSLSPNTIFGNSSRCNPARMSDNSLWVPTTTIHTLVNTNLTGTNFTIPAVTEPVGSQLWVSTTGSSGGSSSSLSTWTTTTVPISATTTNPTKGTIDKDVMRYRKVGDKIYQVQISYRQTAGGAAGSGIYLYTLPAGLQFDTNVQRTSTNGNAASIQTGLAWAAKITGSSAMLYVPGSVATMVAHAYDATSFYLVTVGGAGGAAWGVIQYHSYFQTGQELWVDVDFTFTATT